MRTIDVNADAGEGFGNWSFGSDAELIPLVSSVDIACGWHAGDPAIMRRSVQLAKEHGVALGAHPGFPDLLGFGRRMIEATHDEVVDMVTYQVGALMAFAEQEGMRLSHVKPHSKLYVAIARDEDLMCKVADAVLQLQDDLIMFMLAGAPAENLKKRGYRTCAEVAVDMDYADDGRLLIENKPAWKDPEYVANKALQAAQNFVETTGGGRLEFQIDTMCIHGDRPNCVDIATAIRSSFEREGVTMQAPGRPQHVASGA